MHDTWLDLTRGSRVVVAMSGGVDSSVAAALLVERECEVIGITMKNFCYSDVPEENAAAACCSLEAIEDARAVARRLGIPHHILDFEGPFREAVIDPFVSEYAAGRTPNPCVRCNRFVRFPQLWRKARVLGAEAVATGHYARAVRSENGGVELLRPADRSKDQTFYLWGLSAALLERAAFPLGGLTKDKVRERARELDLKVADKPESQDICFVPGGDLRTFLEESAASRSDLTATGRFRPGPVKTLTGGTIAEHPGSAFFTVGQRRGLRLAGMAEPHYVVAIEKDNTVVVGPDEALETRCLDAEDVHWISAAPVERFRARVQIRYRSPAATARVIPGIDRTARVEFDRPQRAVAPGQSVVFYDRDRLLGGGTIARAILPQAR